MTFRERLQSALEVAQSKLTKATADEQEASGQIRDISDVLETLNPTVEKIIEVALQEHTADVAETVVGAGSLNVSLPIEAKAAVLATEMAGDSESLDQTGGDPQKAPEHVQEYLSVDRPTDPAE